MARLLTPTVAGGTLAAISIAKPTGASPRDYAMVFLWNNESVYTDNNGAAPFAFDAAVFNVAGIGSLRVAVRTLDGTEGANFLFNNAAGVRWGAVCHVWQGLNSSPISVARSNGNSSTPAVTAGTAVSINTLNPNDIHIVMYGTDGINTLIALNQAGYTLAGLVNVAGCQNLAVAYKVIAAPGATGTVAFTQNSESYMAASMALKDNPYNRITQIKQAVNRAGTY